jgi:hypothetical protein
MNAQNQWMNKEETEPGYTVSYSRRDQSREQQMHRHAYERPSARPNSFNGMHRRRNKRFSM